MSTEMYPFERSLTFYKTATIGIITPRDYSRAKLTGSVIFTSMEVHRDMSVAFFGPGVANFDKARTAQSLPKEGERGFAARFGDSAPHVVSNVRDALELARAMSSQDDVLLRAAHILCTLFTKRYVPENPRQRHNLACTAVALASKIEIDDPKADYYKSLTFVYENEEELRKQYGEFWDMSDPVNTFVAELDIVRAVGGALCAPISLHYAHAASKQTGALVRIACDPLVWCTFSQREIGENAERVDRLIEGALIAEACVRRREEEAPREMPLTNDYTIGVELGKGKYGRVALATRGSHTFACKMTHTQAFDQLPTSFLIEWATLHLFAEIRTPYVVRLVDAFVLPPECYLILEKCECSLKDVNLPIAHDRAIQCARDLFSGLECIHTHGICHRDIKPHNILVTSDWRFKIADFNVATTTCMSTSRRFGRGMQPPSYSAPEVTARSTSYFLSVDVWSAGCVLSELLTGKPLFDTVEKTHSTAAVLADRALLGTDRHPSWERVILGCLAINPDDRFTATEALEATFELS